MDNFQEYLFRFHELGWSSDEADTVLLTQNIETELPLPCPGIMRQKDIDSALQGKVRPGKLFAHAIIPFCVRKGRNTMLKVGVTTNLVPQESKSLLHNHRVEVVDKFPLKSIAEIAKTANELGGLSFILHEPKAMITTLNSWVNKASKIFKFVECMKYDVDKAGKASEEDRLTLSMTFMDLRYCIPIYNAKRVDGVGVLVTLFYPESSQKRKEFRYRDRFAVVLSNYEDNLYKTDGGSVINNREGYPTGLTSHCIANVKADANTKPEAKPKAKVSLRTKARKAGKSYVVEQYLEPKYHSEYKYGVTYKSGTWGSSSSTNTSSSSNW